jgi:cytochrome c biogenesis protein CcmG, thiol:disulfide interchange protein DsbE
MDIPSRRRIESLQMKTGPGRRPGGISKKRITGVFVLIAAVFGVFICFGQAKPPAHPQPQSGPHSQSLIGKSAPQFARRDLNGRTVDLRSLRGKVVLLNFWATWCAPCQSELPVFNSWQRSYNPRGFQVIGISMDDDADSARSLVNRLRLDYPVAMGDAKLGVRYGGVLGLPKTFLIGRDGKVQAEFQGESDLKSIEGKILAALN